MSKKILLLLRHSGYLRLFQPVVKKLTEQGHQVSLGFPKFYWLHPESAIKEYFGDCPNLRYFVFNQQKTRWDNSAKLLRLFQNYLRYLEPEFKDAPKLRERASRSFPKWFTGLCESYFCGNKKRIWRFIRLLRKIERLIPVPDYLTSLLSNENPDIVIIAPFVELPAVQTDWLKAAQKLNIPAAIWIASWDNLTSKGLVQRDCARVIVWNNFQKDELINLHRVDEKYISVTGAQCYDWWFDYKPQFSREKFCSQIGISPEKKYILYLGSSPFIFQNEYRFVDTWLRKLREKGLEDVGVLLRPHPQNYEQWDQWDRSQYSNVVIFPDKGANPIESKSQSDYFHSLYYSSAVVGVNTSAMIESGILSKPVYTVSSEACEGTQSGTLHFRYLQENGLLEFDTDLDEHVDKLKKLLHNGTNSKKELQKAFIKSFVRPHGIEKDATSIAVKEILKIDECQENFYTNLSFQEKTLGRPLFYVFTVLVNFGMFLTKGKRKKVRK